MHVSLLHRLFLLLGFAYTLTLAFSIPASHAGSKAVRDVSSSQNELVGVLLEGRSPKGSRGGSRQPMPKLSPRPKSTPKSKPTPKPKSAPKPSPKPKSSSTRTATAVPKSSAITFPTLKVPYVNTPTNLCDIYITCRDKYAGSDQGPTVRRDVHDQEHDQYGHSLMKRARNVDGLKTLAYPESSKLYTADRITSIKHVFRFQNNKMGSSVIKDFSTITGDYADYATEHILELQTIPMFHRYAEAQDSTLVAFFQNEWDKSRTQSVVEGRTPKPKYFDDQIKGGVRPKRLSLNQLVFEAFGSTINPDDFVLLESEINLYKMELWSLKNPMTEIKYEKAYKSAMSGARPSSDYLSAIRTVFAVFSYLKSSTVHDNIRSINANIRLELSNAAYVTSQPNLPNLVPIWDSFLDQHFTKIENWGQKWARERIAETLKALNIAMTKYEKMFQERKKAELTAQKSPTGNKKKGKGPLTYSEKQKQEQNELTAKLTQQARVVQQHKAELRTLEQTKTTGWDKKRRDVHNERIAAAKADLFEAQKAHGLTQRAIHELYSYSVKNIITNLKKDQERLMNFQKTISTLSMPRI